MVRLSNAIIAASLALACAAPVFALDCPDKKTIRAAIRKYITVDYWSPGEREVWKVKDVGSFDFGPIKAGKIIRRVVDYNSGSTEVCPVRTTFSFAVTRNDGSTEKTTMGEGKIFLFYQDALGDWVFKID